MEDFSTGEPCACEPGTDGHSLPDLEYGHDALEPHVDTQTMKIHHGGHHASYVKKLNGALEDLGELKRRPALWLLLHLDEVPEDARTAVRNNGGGHVNHCLFWRAMSPDGGRTPTGALARAIDQDLGGHERFKKEFETAGAKIFGSGWVWLVVGDDGKLRITTTQGHDNPAMDGMLPILVNDMWEHAYYLKHQNRKESYLDGWWSVVDWAEAGRRYERA